LSFLLRVVLTYLPQSLEAASKFIVCFSDLANAIEKARKTPNSLRRQGLNKAVGQFVELNDEYQKKTTAYLAALKGTLSNMVELTLGGNAMRESISSACFSVISSRSPGECCYVSVFEPFIEVDELGKKLLLLLDARDKYFAAKQMELSQLKTTIDNAEAMIRDLTFLVEDADTWRKKVQDAEEQTRLAQLHAAGTASVVQETRRRSGGWWLWRHSWSEQVSVPNPQKRITEERAGALESFAASMNRVSAGKEERAKIAKKVLDHERGVRDAAVAKRTAVQAAFDKGPLLLESCIMIVRL